VSLQLKILAIAAGVMVCCLGLAQDPNVFRVQVRVVTVPTVVTSTAQSRNGQYIRDLGPADFELADNDRDQVVHLDYAAGLLSLAIVVQTNEAVRAWLPEVRRVASVVEASLLGETGEASVTTFSDDVKLLQPVTANTVLLDKAFASISPTGEKSRCLDAVTSAAKLLSRVPAGRRRVVLLVAQAGDGGSSSNLREALETLERSDITVYSLVMPRIGKDLINKTVSVHGVSGVFGAGDTGIMATIDLGKLIPEIYRGARAAAAQNYLTILTTQTAGRQASFRNLRELENGVSAIGDELHTQYVLSYTPDLYDPGYHHIRVHVHRAQVLVRWRPGYFVSQADTSR
jgi:VWFA-related protein